MRQAWRSGWVLNQQVLVDSVENVGFYSKTNGKTFKPE